MPPGGILKFCTHSCHKYHPSTNRNVTLHGVQIFCVDGKSLKSHLKTHGACTCGGAERLTALHFLRFGHRLCVAYTSPPILVQKIKEGYKAGWREFFGPDSEPRYHRFGGKDYPYDLSDLALLSQLASVPWTFQSLSASGLPTTTPSVLLDQLPPPVLGSGSTSTAPTATTVSPALPQLNIPSPAQLGHMLSVTSTPSTSVFSNATTPYTSSSSCSFSPVHLESVVGLPGECAQRSPLRNVIASATSVGSLPIHLRPLLQKLMESRYNLHLKSGVAGLQARGLKPAEGLHPIHEYAERWQSVVKQNVLLILSPVWAWSPGGSQPDASFSTQELPNNFAKRIREKEKDCRPWKWIKPRSGSSKAGHRRCMMNDWLYFASSFVTDKDKWNLATIWSPQDLVQLVTEGHPKQVERLSEIRGCDFVFGGPFWNGDIMQEMGEKVWRMTGEQLRHLRVFLDRLPESGITVWPLPTDLLVNGMKVYQYRQIWLSAFALGQASPALAIVRSRHELIRIVQQYQEQDAPWACVKRERSKEGKHAFFPEDDEKMRPQSELARLDLHLAEEDQSFRQSDAKAFGLRPPRWFIQPYIPQMRFLGEIRVVCINGIIAVRQYTTPVTVQEMDGQTINRGFTTYVDVRVPDSTHIRHV